MGDQRKGKDMRQNPDPSEDSVPSSGEMSEGVEEDSPEYDHLNTTLDELDTCLDTLEQQNDDLYTKLQDLLESSRQTRQELEEERKKDSGKDGAGNNSESFDKANTNS